MGVEMGAAPGAAWGITLREAKVADVPRLLELYKQLEITPEPEVALAAAQAHFLDMATNPRHRYYVAESDGRIVGTMSMLFMPGLSHSARESCVVEDVVVSPEVQGMGIGRQMMRFAMQASAARHCYKLVLSSHLMRDLAHLFYENLGFRKHGYSFLIDPSDPGNTSDSAGTP